MKKDWAIKKLGEVCEIKDSQRKPITANKRKQGPIPYYGATGILDYVDGYLFDEDLILLGEDGAKWGSGDRSAFKISGKTWVNNHAHVLKPANYIDYTWLIYYLNYSDLTTFVKGATVPKLNQENTRNIPIPLPPLEEQKRIVDVLDKKFAQIETLKTAAEKNLQNTKQLFQAELEKAFSNTSWENKKLFEICENIVDCPHTTPKKSAVPTDYPCIRTSELKNGEIDWTTMQYLEKDEYLKRITRLEPKENDIVYGREGTFGDAVILPNTHHFSLGQRTMLLRANTNIVNPKFLLKAIISPYVYKQALAKNNGCGVPHVNVADVKNFLIPLPPLEEQKRIVAHLDSLSEKDHQLEEIYTKQLADCDELKQAFLQKAFEGEL